MSEVQLWDEEEGREGLVPATVKAAVRGKTVQQLSELIDALHPYALGLMGEPNARLAEIYIAAMRQRGLLVGAYSHQPVREPVVEVEVIEATAEDGRILGQRVLEDLTEMENRMRKEGKMP